MRRGSSFANGIGFVRSAVILLLTCLTGSMAANAEEPALPMGLSVDPGGDEPALPAGLGMEEVESPEKDAAEPSTATISGFWDFRLGLWGEGRPYLGSRSLGESRLQLKVEEVLPAATLQVTADLLYDDLAADRGMALETGEGWIDLRTAYVAFSPLTFMDVKLGRQILTWGTGDLIFINDLFPKDWNAFLIGRDEAYLKAPSDALKLSFFSGAANLDLVYTPRFDADRFIDGSRASYFSPTLGRIAGTDAIVAVERPDRWFRDDELALRLYRNLAAYEVALYGYRGFWKSPGGSNPVTGRLLFPRLSVWGASLRGPLAGGIINAEWGYYDSRDDPDGANARVNNSEQRWLLGYEHELANNLTLGLQYYLKRMSGYDAYRRTLPPGITPARRTRQEITARLTWLTLNQNLVWSVFLFYSPSDDDGYLRPKVHYKYDDHWSWELGANIFRGNQPQTFFGQFRENDNLYSALRYGF